MQSSNTKVILHYRPKFLWNQKDLNNIKEHDVMIKATICNFQTELENYMVNDLTISITAQKNKWGKQLL